MPVAHGGCEAKHIVFGCGGQPRSGVEESRSRRIVDVSRLLGFTFPETLSRILVVGGGQSAAECLNYLLDKFSERPVRIDWVTSETSFRALDTSNFSREMFSTAYAQVFSSLTSKAREKINNDDKSVANGMLPLLAQALYQRLYQLRHLPAPEKACPTVHVQANTEVVEVRENPSGVSVKASIVSAGKTDVAEYDCVILCTGLDDETILESSVIGPELRRRIEKKSGPHGIRGDMGWPIRPHDLCSIAEQRHARIGRFKLCHGAREERGHPEFHRRSRNLQDRRERPVGRLEISAGGPTSLLEQRRGEGAPFGFCEAGH